LGFVQAFEQISIFKRCKKQFVNLGSMQSGRKIVLDSLMKIPEIGDVLVSPNKKHVALMVNRIHENYDIFLGSIQQSTDLIALTDTPEYTTLRDWSADSKSIVVAQDKSRNERTTLYRVYIDSPKEMIPITDLDPNHFMRGGYFGPDGSFIVYAVNYDFDIKRETETFRIVVQDIETGKKKVIARPDKPTYTELSIEPRGKYVLYCRSDEDPSGIQWWIASVDGNEDREVLNFGPQAKVSADWTFDGRILFNTDTLRGERHDSVAIGLYDLTDNEIQWLTKFSNDEPYDDSFVPKHSQHIAMVREREARTRHFILDLELATFRDVTPLRGNLLPTTPISSNEWLGLYYSSINPVDLVKFDPRNPNPHDFVFLTNMLERSGIKQEELTPAEELRWISVDNTMIHGWFYRPKETNGKTLVHVHGGPTAHSEDELDIDIQFFCSLGYSILDPNYRGSTGYGVNFRELIKQDGWGGYDKEDVRTGILTLFEKGLAAPNKVGIFGTSYGGYMSWNAITRFPTEVVAAAAPICGMTDLVVDYETTRPDLRTYSEEMLGGSPKDNPELYRQRSPINYVQNIKGNLLIVQGLMDPNVTKANVMEVEKRLKMYDIEYEKLVFKDEGHGILREKNVRILLEKLASFFEKAL
jgi:dipeptidyl aminopeptidase/acylaminoacyl peptidase